MVTLGIATLVATFISTLLLGEGWSEVGDGEGELYHSYELG
jgi:hypothetical protein